MANPEHLAILKKGVEAWNEWTMENPEIRPDLTEADLRRIDLSPVLLSETDVGAEDVIRANLIGANLRRADLSDADLSDAFLRYADLSGAFLSGADLGHAKFDHTTIVNVNLSEVKGVKGLDEADHWSPSSIGIDTFFRSQGKIPEEFLRGAGVPDDFITYAKSLVGKAIEFYSCFISYSSKDQNFAERLDEPPRFFRRLCYVTPARAA